MNRIDRRGNGEVTGMEEVEATLYDGETVVISGITVLIDAKDSTDGSTATKGWHAHAALPLSTVVQPQDQLRIVTADGRSGNIEEIEPSTVEGDRVLHVFTGLGPLKEA
jgi:hypothetical protein